MNDHPNAAVLRRTYEAMRTGDVQTLRALFAPEAVMHVPGRSHNTGTYRGVDEILQFLGHAANYTGGTLRTTVHRVLADDDYAMALATYTATREDGGTLENNLVHVVRLHDGRVTESWFHSRDQYEVDAFWGQE